jgi:hypothetical protein
VVEGLFIALVELASFISMEMGGKKSRTFELSHPIKVSSPRSSRDVRTQINPHFDVKLHGYLVPFDMFLIPSLILSRLKKGQNVAKSLQTNGGNPLFPRGPSSLPPLMSHS